MNDSSMTLSELGRQPARGRITLKKKKTGPPVGDRFVACIAAAGALLCGAQASAEVIGHTSSTLTAANTPSTDLQPDTTGNNGLLGYTYQLEVPEARGRMVTPQVVLTYLSGRQAGLVGRGWDLPLTYVERRFMRRTPLSFDQIQSPGHFNPVEFDLHIGGQVRALTDEGNGTFRADVETTFIELKKVGDTWEGYDASGLRYVFSLAQLGNYGETYRWYVSRIIDPSGNECSFVYDRPFGQLGDFRVSKIRYNNLKNVIKFIYGQSQTPPIYRTVFGTTMILGDQLTEIQVISQDESFQDHRWRTYFFEYTRGTASQLPLLNRITVTGFDVLDPDPPAGQPDAVLPSTTFTYADHLSTFALTPHYITDPQGNMPKYMSRLPYIPGGSDGSHQYDSGAFHDLNGDSRPDLVETRFLRWGAGAEVDTTLYPLSPELSPYAFENKRSVHQGTNLGVSQGQSDIIDLNGDGIKDVLKGLSEAYFSSGGPTPQISSTAETWYISDEVRNELWSLNAASDGVIWTRQLSAQERASDESLDIVSRREVVARIIDMTGDGIPDMVIRIPGQNDWYVYAGFINGSSGGFSKERMVFDFDEPAPYLGRTLIHRNTTNAPWGGDLVETRIVMIDLDGDGLIDVIPQRFDGVADHIFLNNGRGFTRVPWSIPRDLINAHPDQMVRASVTWTLAGESEDFQTHGLLDINGDGFVDALVTTNDNIRVFYGTGRGFGPTSSMLFNSAFPHGTPFLARWHTLDSAQYTGFADLTSDGLPDYIYNTDHGGSWQFFRNLEGSSTWRAGQPRSPDLLTSIANGIGAETHLEYGPLAQQEGIHVPFNYDVVTEIENRMPGRDPSQWPRPVAMTYTNATMHQDPDTKLYEFRGVEVVERKQGRHGTITQYMVSDRAYNGRKRLEHRTGTNGCIITTQLWTWDTKQAGRGSDPSRVKIPFRRALETRRHQQTGLCDDALHEFDRVLPAMTSRSEIRSVDAYGNPTLVAELGFIQQTDDDVFIERTYASSINTVGTAPVVRNAVATMKQCTTAQCGHGAILGQYDYFYDGVANDSADRLSLGQVDLGRLKHAQVHNYDLDDLTLSPDVFVQRMLTYDQFGNLSSEFTNIGSGLFEETVTLYDTTFHMYKRMQVRANGEPETHSKHYVYDAARGFLIEEQDGESSFGRMTYYTPDLFNRTVKAEAMKDGHRETMEEVELTFLSDGFERVERIFSSTNRFTERTRRFDAMGREVRVWRTLGASHGNHNLIEREVVYEEYGQILYEKSEHRDDEATPITSYYHYDAFLRPSVVTRTPFLGAGNLPQTFGSATLVSADTYVERLFYSWTNLGVEVLETYYGQDPRLTSVLPRSLQHRTKVLHPDGRLMRVRDWEGEQIDYTYDRLNNAARVTRYAGPNQTQPVETTAGFDTLGRKLRMVEPDRGHRHFSYRPDGFLMEVQIADIKTPTQFEWAIRYDRDVLGRETQRGEHKADAVGWQQVRSASMVYDTGPTGNPADQQWGRLAATIDDNGDTSEFVYDELGNMTGVRRTIARLAGSALVPVNEFEIQRSFDLQGRLTEVRYPDDTGAATLAVTYSRTSGGFLETVAGPDTYYDVQSFSPVGSPTEIHQGSSMDIIERRAFNTHTRQLIRHEIFGPNRNIVGPRFELTDWQYDGMGRLTGHYDRNSGDRHRFEYDRNGRLTLAEKTASGPGSGWHFTYSYDALGNLTGRAVVGGTSYPSRTFNMAVPQRGSGAIASYTTSSSSDVFSVDYRYGNIVAVQTNCASGPCANVRTMRYDRGDHLLEATEPSTQRVHTYEYDALGRRTFEEVEVANNVTKSIYTVGPWIRVVVDNQNGTYVVEQNIYANDRMVATRQVIGGQRQDRLLYAKDHLGHVRSVYNRVGAEIGKRDYLPFGEMDFAGATGIFDYSMSGREVTLGGMVYFGARFYDPSLMRFVSADTIIPSPLMTDAYNRYAYVYNSPVSYVDGDGRFALLIIVAAGAIFGGLSAATAALNADRSGWEVVGFTVLGAVLGGAGALAGHAVGKWVVNTVTFHILRMWLIKAVIQGAISGAIGSAFTGLGAVAAKGKFDLGSYLEKIGIGAAVGAVVNGVFKGLEKLGNIDVGADWIHGKAGAKESLKYIIGLKDQKKEAKKSGSNLTMTRVLGLNARFATGVSASESDESWIVPGRSLDLSSILRTTEDLTHPFIANHVVPWLQEQELNVSGEFEYATP